MLSAFVVTPFPLCGACTWAWQLSLDHAFLLKVRRTRCSPSQRQILSPLRSCWPDVACSLGKVEPKSALSWEVIVSQARLVSEQQVFNLKMREFT